MPKTKTKKGNCALMFWNIPIKLKVKFKAKCASKNITMGQAIISLMKKFK